MDAGVRCLVLYEDVTVTCDMHDVLSRFLGLDGRPDGRNQQQYHRQECQFPVHEWFLRMVI